VLPSTLFRVEAGPAEDGGRLVLQGRGNGHGVGMCQWGAIGRARAGQTYVHILSAYYPGAQLRTVY
jgi:SpoIID/LytB domain protein